MILLSRCYISFLIIGLLLTVNRCVDKQKIGSKQNYPSDISQYEFLRYSGGEEVISPDHVVRADNNREILLAC